MGQGLSALTRRRSLESFDLPASNVPISSGPAQDVGLDIEELDQAGRPVGLSGLRYLGSQRAAVVALPGVLAPSQRQGHRGHRAFADTATFAVELARLAAETGLRITVCHYPPGTSKWNQIEHRMLSFITINWRSRPLTSLRTIVELISATSTTTGLTMQAAHDPTEYPKGVKISGRQLAAIPLQPHDWHGEWNYTLDVNQTWCEP
jgi:hypothetical protein